MTRVRGTLVKAAAALAVGFGAFWFLTWKNPVLHNRIWGPAQLRYTEQAYAETQQRGERLIAALKAWRGVRGEYPATLNESVPGKLPSIELPLVGHGAWTYERVAPDRFGLKFFVGPTYESDSYDSDKGTWYVDR